MKLAIFSILILMMSLLAIQFSFFGADVPDALLPSAPQSKVLPSTSTPNGVSGREPPSGVTESPEFFTIPAITNEELALNDSFERSGEVGEYKLWHRSYGDLGSSRYSTLDQINRGNVRRLKLAWRVEMGEHRHQVQASPVIVDDLVISVTSANNLVALDGKTGEVRWRYLADKMGILARRGLVFRPGAEDGGGTLYLASGDRLLAMNPVDGRLRKGFGKEGEGFVDLTSESRIAPVFMNDRVFVAGIKPSIQAFDVKTGETIWESNLWPVEARSPSAQLWSGMSIDSSRGLIFATLGNPKPALDGRARPGDNLYSNSILAINAADGSVRWAFQDTRHDLWDLDVSSPPLLTSIKREGLERRIDVVVAASKTGNVLLLDRVSGKPIFDFRLRRAPASDIYSEQTAEFQPAPLLPEPFGRQNFELSDVTDLSESKRTKVLERLSSMQFGFYTPPNRLVPLVYFGVVGGAEWPGGSVDQPKGLLYLASNHIPWEVRYGFFGRGSEEKTLVSSAKSLLKDIYRHGFSSRRVNPDGYERFCSSCHGNLTTNRVAPSLRKLGDRFTRDYVAGVVRNGFEGMSPVSNIEADEIEDVLDFLFSRGSKNEDFFSRFTDEQSFVAVPFLDDEGYPASKPPWGKLSCIDLNTGKIRWSIPFGEHEALSKRGFPITGTMNFGGPTVTAGGLVFVSGARDRMLRVFDSATGEELWKYELPFVGTTPPAIYEVGGREYVFISATGGGNLATNDSHGLVKRGSSLLAFSLE